MNELTREELIMWLENPFTKGFYKVLKDRRKDAEDRAFVATLDNYKKSGLCERTSTELFAYRNLEVLNGLLIQTFEPLYDYIKSPEAILNNEDLNEKEQQNDPLQNFINQILNKND